MIKSAHPYNIQQYIRTRVDLLRGEDHQLLPQSCNYYDILSDVYSENDRPIKQNILFNPDIDNDYENTTTFGLVEYSSLGDAYACVKYLEDRDKTPTFLTGIFAGEPYNCPFMITRNGFGIFKDYTVTHTGYVYFTNSLRLSSNTIHPSLLIQPDVDMKGYLTYSLPIPGYGSNISVCVHELVGMTFLPPFFYNSDMFVYYHRNGDKTDCHFQNIGVMYA